MTQLWSLLHPHPLLFTVLESGAAAAACVSARLGAGQGGPRRAVGWRRARAPRLAGASIDRSAAAAGAPGVGACSCMLKWDIRCAGQRRLRRARASQRRRCPPDLGAAAAPLRKAPSAPPPLRCAGESCWGAPGRREGAEGWRRSSSPRVRLPTLQRRVGPGRAPPAPFHHRRRRPINCLHPRHNEGTPAPAWWGRRVVPDRPWPARSIGGSQAQPLPAG